MLLKVITLATVLFSSIAMGANEPDLESTVKSIILQDNPEISFHSREYSYLYSTIKPQIEAIFANHIKPEMQSAMYQGLSISPTTLMLKAIDGVDLKPELSVDGELSTAVPELNTLITKYEISKIEPMSFGNLYILTFKADENPRVIAKELAELSVVEFAEADAIVGGSERLIKRLSDVLYVVEISWGDCPAGCINSNRTYVEAYHDGKTFFVGRAGDELDRNLLERIFVNP